MKLVCLGAQSYKYTVCSNDLEDTEGCANKKYIAIYIYIYIYKEKQ